MRFSRRPQTITLNILCAQLPNPWHHLQENNIQTLWLVQDIQMLGYDWCEVHTLMRQPDWCEIHTTLYALKKKKRKKKTWKRLLPVPSAVNLGTCTLSLTRAAWAREVNSREICTRFVNDKLTQSGGLPHICASETSSLNCPSPSFIKLLRFLPDVR